MNQKGFIPLLVVFISVLILGAVAGAYFYSITQTKKLSTQNLPTPKPTIIDLYQESGPVASVFAISNWKTYINTKYNYSFKYPEELQLKSFPNTNPIEESSTIIVGTPSPPTLVVSYILKDSNEDLEQLVNRNLLKFGNPKMLVINKNKIDSHSSIYIEGSVLVGAKPAKQYFVYIEKDAHSALRVNSDSIYPGENDSVKSTFDQILSTFKFTE
jgi:hypothetical protein